MSKKYDLCVAIGSYQKEGQDKTQWLNIGKVLQKKDGSGFVMKLDCTPTSVIDREGNSVAWDGWVQMFEAKPKEQKPQPHSNQSGGIPVPEKEFDQVPF